MKSQKWILSQNVEIVKNFYTYKIKKELNRIERYAIDHLKPRNQQVSIITIIIIIIIKAHYGISIEWLFTRIS